jgi:DNA-binding transcriptional LysR family regulator
MNEPRLRSLLPLWPWLPAFRVVAETEHLPTAATLAATTPSSLSRSIALLERQLGRAVFNRRGRTLVLNDDGRQLLMAVRDAMRRVDDGLQEIGADEPHGPLTIGMAGAGVAAFVAPAMGQLLAEHPRLSPALVTLATADILSALRTGRADIVVSAIGGAATDLISQRVGALQRSVYCGPPSRCYAAPETAIDALMNEPFVAPAAGSVEQDGWPTEHARRIALTIEPWCLAPDICAQSPFLAALPNLVGDRDRRLRRLPAFALPPAAVTAIMRRPLSKARAQSTALVLALLGSTTLPLTDSRSGMHTADAGSTTQSPDGQPTA